MTGFASLTSDAQGFLQRLAQNNNKAWWDENKATYDHLLKAPALDLLDRLEPQVAALTDTEIKPKLFRPHRDVRFSKDKTPYKTHLHMLWQMESDARQSPVFFFGVGLDYVSVGAGIMGFDAPVLADWRKFVDLDTQRILHIMGKLEDAGYALREPALKRVPNAYDRDHDGAYLLRMKAMIASRDIGHVDDIPSALIEGFHQLWPLNALLQQVAEA